MAEHRKEANKYGVAELFGYASTARTQEAILSRQNYSCPFLGRRCTKKSEYRGLAKDIPFGACSVWYKGKATVSTPHIICPIRFEQDATIFQEAAKLLTAKPDTEVVVVAEITIHAFGRVDFIVTQKNKLNNNIVNFIILEVMAVSTTGTGQIIQAMLDRLNQTNQATNKYGINFRQVISRLIVQGVVKAEACESWGKQMIWAVQDVFLAYMLKTTQLNLTQLPNSPDHSYAAYPVIFQAYQLRFDEPRGIYHLTLSAVCMAAPLKT